MSRVAVRLIIRGLVQGVGFRWWARGQARRLNLAGWVRNRSDGSVELVAAGPPGAIEALVTACRRGPASAEVTAVERFEAEDEPLEAFEMRSTA